jgi:hypothetical protein
MFEAPKQFSDWPAYLRPVGRILIVTTVLQLVGGLLGLLYLIPNTEAFDANAPYVFKQFFAFWLGGALATPAAFVVGVAVQAIGGANSLLAIRPQLLFLGACCLGVGVPAWALLYMAIG